MGGGSFSERLTILLMLVPLVHVAVMRYSAELSLAKNFLLELCAAKKYGIKMRSDTNLCNFEKNNILYIIQILTGPAETALLALTAHHGRIFPFPLG